MDLSLTGETTAIVTGGANGIVAAVSERLASAGQSISIWDIDERAGEELVDAIRRNGVVPESWTPNLGFFLQGVVRCMQEAR